MMIHSSKIQRPIKELERTPGEVAVSGYTAGSWQGCYVNFPAGIPRTNSPRRLSVEVKRIKKKC